MSESRSQRRVAAGVSLALLTAVAAHAQDGDLRWSGYNKNLLLRSDTWAGEPYALDLNRLRVEAKGRVVPALSFDIQADNELLLGNYLHTTQFQQQKDAASPQYWDLNADYVDTRHAFGRLSLYRATLQLSVDNTDLRVGRQRIAWGTGRFWSPLDVLNPVNPIALEREERPGVDAALLEHKAGPLSRWSVVVAPSRVPGDSTLAAQWHDNSHGLDYSLVAGRMRGDPTLGFDLAGQIGQAGVRAEMTHQWPNAAGARSRVLLGVDYAFDNTLTLSVELFSNGAGATRPSAYNFADLMSGKTTTLGRHYAGAHLAYEITPLLKWGGDLIVNVADGSHYIASSLTWSLRDNVDAQFGFQHFSGASGSEYSRPPDAVYAQIQRFF
jgi:hypothetical protein